MLQAVFQEQQLYYQYELVRWEGQLQPVVSMWVYLGRQVLSSDLSPNETVGHVFALWQFECGLGWHASSSVTQVFWNLGDAKERMRPWVAFSSSILAQLRSSCKSRTSHGGIGMELLVSLARDSMKLTDTNRSESIKHKLYYQMGYYDPRGPICITRLCEERDRYYERRGCTLQGSRWLAFDVFSRGLGLERIGPPQSYARDKMGETWQVWCQRTLPFAIARESGRLDEYIKRLQSDNQIQEGDE